MKARAVRHGRRPEQLRIFPGAVIYAGESDAHAREKNSREMQALIKPNVGIRHLSHYVDMDLTGCDLDDPFPELSKGISGRLQPALRDRQRSPTRRSSRFARTYERFLPSFGHTVMVGGGKTIAPIQIRGLVPLRCLRRFQRSCRIPA